MKRETAAGELPNCKDGVPPLLSGAISGDSGARREFREWVSELVEVVAADGGKESGGSLDMVEREDLGSRGRDAEAGRTWRGAMQVMEA